MFTERKYEEIQKARQLPYAVNLRNKMNEQCDILDDIKLTQSHELDRFNYMQLCYKAFTIGHLTEEEDLALQSLMIKLDIRDKEFEYVVKKK